MYGKTIGGDYTAARLNKVLQLTQYSALFQCADIFTSPKRAVLGS